MYHITRNLSKKFHWEGIITAGEKKRIIKIQIHECKTFQIPKKKSKKARGPWALTLCLITITMVINTFTSCAHHVHHLYIVMYDKQVHQITPKSD